MGMEKPVLLVLAAGMGSRYGGLKQIESVGPDGEILIDYSIFDAVRAGFGRVVFVIRRDIEKLFKDIIGSRFASRLSVDYVCQELADLPPGFPLPAARRKPWGTGHAVLSAQTAIQGPFAVINADDFYGQASYALLQEFLAIPQTRDRPCYALVGFTLRNTLSDFGHVARGICTCDAGLGLTRVEERTHLERDGEGAIDRSASGEPVRLTGDEYVSMNMWGFTADVFAHLERGFESFLQTDGGDGNAEYYLPFAIDQVIREKRADCRVLPTVSRWAGVTYKEDRGRLQRFMEVQAEAGRYPRPLWPSRTAAIDSVGFDS